ncbi:hypothetical protein Ancab_037814 [Ancistrocladus abbreviatus]
MAAHIPDKVKRLWNIWDVQASVLASLALQTLLLLFAPLKKRTANGFLSFLIWLLYFLSDWVTIFAIGLISKTLGGSTTPSRVENPEILAFWAAFLLLHLGGPHEKALSMEDNKLWVRYLAQYLAQISATIYVLYLASASKELPLWAPIIPVFLAGTIRVGERTLSLYLSGLDRFRNSLTREPDPGRNFSQLMADYKAVSSCIPELDNFTMVQYAHGFFTKFKALIVDIVLSFDDCHLIRQFFLTLSTEDALQVLEIELNFVYDVFYTKAVLKDYIKMYHVRGFCLGFVIASLLLFRFKKPPNLGGSEVVITYVLLWGAMALEIITTIKLIISHWTIVALGNASFKRSIIFSRSITKLFKFLNKISRPRFLERRWSESISQFDLLDYCLKQPRGRFTVLLYRIGLEDLIIGFIHVSRVRLSHQLRDFIFKVLRSKYDEHIGEVPLRRWNWGALPRDVFEEFDLPRWNWALPQDVFIHGVSDITYDESVLIWHIATEILFGLEEGRIENDGFHHLFWRRRNISNGSRDRMGTSEDALCSKILSRYITYLLLWQPTITSAVSGIAHMRFQDTFAEAKNYHRMLRERKPFAGKDQLKCLLELVVNWEMDGAPRLESGSKSVWLQGVNLAKELGQLEARQWRVICSVWVELLAYAAIRCRPEGHIQQLGTGGELITIVCPSWVRGALVVVLLI